MAQTVKHLPAIKEIWVKSLGWEDPLEKQISTHSSTFAWKIPWTEKPGGLQPVGSQRVRHDWATSLTLAWIRLPIFTAHRINLKLKQNSAWSGHYLVHSLILHWYALCSSYTGFHFVPENKTLPTKSSVPTTLLVQCSLLWPHWLLGLDIFKRAS